ncbi:host-nuclease inhibitor Gam family protein [Aquibacillus saliphilus]|uniref:host-nuclease inhibitor Gam family protein n=1 Tax=Aquibacillus saliphilus TaxID=1909422 RepID=UPI001CF09182|nr:host-nuclease inhibitor Gam family protein [Aquibacillus saliphilus]
MESNQIDELEYEDLDATKLEQWKVDALIEDIRENNNDIKKYKDILDKRIAELKLNFENKKTTLEKRNHYLLSTLNTYAKQQKDLKSTKTQWKYSSLSGDILIKKPLPKLQKPVKDTYKDIQKLYPELVEDVTEQNLNWKDLKSKLVVQNGEVYDKESGENLSSYIDIEISDEETIVK